MAGLSLLKGSGSVFSISLRLHLVPLLVKFIMKSSHYLNISVNLFPLLILNKTSAIDPPAGCLLHLVHHLHRVWFIIFYYYYLQHFQCQIIVIILNLFVLNVKASQIISTSFLTLFFFVFFSSWKRFKSQWSLSSQCFSPVAACWEQCWTVAHYSLWWSVCQKEVTFLSFRIGLLH